MDRQETGLEAGDFEMSISVHVLRVTLEAETPLSIGSSNVVERTVKEEVPVSPTAIMRDPNGLPTIPGSSTQGVLRRLMEDTAGKERAKEIFGYEGTDGEGQTAGLSVSWGCVHDSSDVAIAGGRSGNWKVILFSNFS